MAEFSPASLTDLLRWMRGQLTREDAIFHLPRRSWWTPDADGPDLSVRLGDRLAGTPVGPAAGPHTQLAQNLVLSWLAGGRILELKTVQLNDRLKIDRPCIDMATVGYNIEWSQELRIDQSAEQYVTGAMLIHMLAAGGLLGDSPLATHATETIFDVSVGYDLAGIQSAPMQAFIEQMRDTRSLVERLRGQIPRELETGPVRPRGPEAHATQCDRPESCANPGTCGPEAHATRGAGRDGTVRRLRDLDYPTRLSNSITLSTFHGCPAEEIERICEFLLSEMDCDVVIKLNPPMLGKLRLEHLLHDVLGYSDLHVPDHAYERGLRFDDAVQMCRRLTTMAASRGRRFGAKFTNTLEVENHGGAAFPAGNRVMYLSGKPLHVLALALADEFRRAVGPDVPFSFSAGVDRRNFAATVACGFRPVTVCTDLLRPGGYGRMPAYLAALSAEMRKCGATNLDEYLRAHGSAGPPWPTHDTKTPSPENDLAADNLARYAAQVQADLRYRAEQNRKAPKRVDSLLDVFDCLACEKCIPVCPNAANFLFDAEPQTITFHDWVVEGDKLTPGPQHTIAVQHETQIANFADFCNACGNCDTFCPEYGGPFIRKPNFYGSLAAWRAAGRDGFYIDAGAAAPCIHGRIERAEYRLAAVASGNEYQFEDGVASVCLRAADHTVASWFAFSPHDASGHVVRMQAYHTLRILLAALLRPDRVHPVNTAEGALALD